MRPKLLTYVRFIAPVALLLTPACYTLLKHPQVRREVYEEVSDTRCNHCHVEDELWSYHHPPNHAYRYEPAYSAWGYYYDVPWWYDAYWYYDQNDPTTIPLNRRGVQFDGPVDLRGTSGGTAGSPYREKRAAVPTQNPGSKDDADKSNAKTSKNRTHRTKKTKKKKTGDG